MSTEILGARSGSFVAAVGLVRGQLCVLNIERGPKYTGTSKEGRGLPGGHMKIEEGKEQPKEGAARELGEEILKPNGEPVITGINPQEFKIVDTGVDYTTKGKKGLWQAGTVWHGHTVRLTATQTAQVLAHIKAMEEDAAYAEAVRAASEQEVWLVHMTPLREMVDGIDSGAVKFAYPHEAAVTKMVALKK